MNNILQQTKSEEYRKKLLQSWIASRIAYNEELDVNEKKPKIKEYEIKYSNFNHGIEEILSSKDYSKNSEFRNNGIMSKHIICKCSNSRLIIALSIIKPSINIENGNQETNFIVDFFKSIEDFMESTIDEPIKINYINKCIYKQGCLIPIGHLVEKLKKGYELVFTGFSFGAALAAVLAIRLLTDTKDLENYELDQISFIGFGCPLFVNEEFQKFIDEQHKDKFHFYRHENDFNVNFFDLNTSILKLENVKSDMNFILNQLNKSKSNVSYHPFELSKGNQEMFRNYLKKVKNQCLGSENSAKENLSLSEKKAKLKQKPYIPFGHNLVIKLADNTDELIEQEYTLMKIHQNNIYRYIEELLNQINLSSKTSIDKYFSDAGFPQNLQQNNQEINYFYDFLISEDHHSYQNYWKTYYNDKEPINFYTVNIIQSAVKTLVFLGICKSITAIYSTLIGSCLIIFDGKTVNGENIIHEENDSNIFWFKFTLNEIPARCNILKFKIYSMYDEILLKPRMDKIVKIDLSQTDMVYDKKRCIYEMSLDFLYIHALVFVYLVNKSDEKDGQIFKNFKKIVQNFKNLDIVLKLQSSNDRTIDKQMYLRNVKNMIEYYDREKSKDEKPIDLNIILKEINNFNNTNNSLKTYLFMSFNKVYNRKLAQVNLINGAKLQWPCFTETDQEIEAFELFRRALLYFKIDQDIDLKYIFGLKEAVKKLNNDNTEPNLHELEKIIKEKYQASDRNLTYLEKRFLSSVVSNFNIREVLENSCLIGIMGHKKAGKSTFVDFMLNEKRNLGSALIETKEMSAYRFDNKIDMLLVDYPHHNSTDEFYAIQFEYSKYILDYAFVVCDTEQIVEDMTPNRVNLFRALNSLGVNRYCVVMNMCDKLIDDFEKKKKDFLVINEINEKKNLIISKLEEFDRKMHFQTNREELKKNLTIIPTCLTLTESSNREIQYKYQRAGILFGENLKRKLLKTIADNIKNQGVKTKLKSYYKTLSVKKCTFITKLKNKYKTVEIDIDKENDKFEDIIDIIKPLFMGIDVSFCIKPELSDSNSKPITSIDEFFDNDGFVFIVEKNNEKECAFVIEENPELKPLEVIINRECKFNELQQKIKEHFSHIKCSFWIKPKISPPDLESTITSTDGFFNSTGFTYIIEIYKECLFEMDQDPNLIPLKKTINRECKFNDFQQEIRKHFKIESLKTFWIKPQISLHNCKPITSTDEFFNSTGFTYIIEIYKECVFEMDQNKTLIPITKTLKFDKLKEKIMEHFNIKRFEQFCIKPDIKPDICEPNSESITSIDDFLNNKGFIFIVFEKRICGNSNSNIKLIIK